MERKIYKQLLAWKESPLRKPLILNGVRQCGKTYILKEFGQREFSHFIYINCDHNEDLVTLYREGFQMDRILRGISALSGKELVEGETFLFFDEVQAYPQVLESLKYFCEEVPQLHVAVAGSLLGIALHQGVSFPVGKVNTMQLFPLDFEEFLMAKGEHQLLKVMQEERFDVLNLLHTKCQDLLRQYYYVGGMPEVVKTYVEKGQLSTVRLQQNEILQNYESDFSKHAHPSEVPRIRMVWQAILGQLSKENKKFVYGALKKGGRAKEFEVAIQWLVDAGLVYKVNRCTNPEFPLKFYEDFSAFKLYLCDCGLMGAMAETAAKDVLITDAVFTEYKGAFTEQYVLQQMLAQGISPIYYYSAENSRMEMDFLVQQEGKLLPIEVKGGTSVKATSLHHYLEQHPELHAIRFSMLPYKEQEHLTNLPLYAVCSLKK